MPKGNFKLPLLVILVGSLTDEFIRQAKIILERLSIEFVLSGNIYSAVGDLATIDNQNVLIVGRFSLLSKEQGRFFDRARMKGYRCCCLIDKDVLRRQRLIIKAIESRAYLIEKAAAIEQVLMELLSGNKVPFSAEKEKHKASVFLKDEFLTTKAELDALLEVESDEKL